LYSHIRQWQLGINIPFLAFPFQKTFQISTIFFWTRPRKVELSSKQLVVNMSRSGSPYGHHVRSLYVQQTRPIIPRQRSNSLPVGLAWMNAEEAGMLFSAAEQATARRKKTYSVDDSYFPDSPPDSRENSPFPTVTATNFKPSPLRQLTSIRASMHKPLPPAPVDDSPQPVEKRPESRKSISPAHVLSQSLIQSLPMSPLSPTKRQVPSHSLKTYADDLFNFTHNILATAIPQLHVDTPQHSPDIVKPQEPASMVFPVPPHFRPTLESRFSDWSITTGYNAESRRGSLTLTPIELNPALMSPDSFFGDEATPKRKDFDFDRFSSVSFASSETYEPPSTLPPPTPPSRALKGSDEEISYFTNFDRFLEQDSTQQAWPLRDSFPFDDVVIDITPIEMLCSPETSAPSTCRPRADTVIRSSVPVRSAPLLTTDATPWSLYSSPSTPIHLAEVAIRVPNWLIGAIG